MAARLSPEQLAHLRARGYLPQEPAKPKKYRNRETKVGDETFDSAKEARRIQELRLLEKAGQIRELQTQVKFRLLPAQVRSDGTKERAVDYIADAVYWQGDAQVVEDTKSDITRKDPVYVLKRKLMLWIHGITIQER